MGHSGAGSLVRAMVANNASWCDVVARAHGCPTRTDATAWTAERRPPALYPDAVTLAPDARADQVLARIEAGPGCGVKDSFARLDLAGAGFHVLLEATWITRRPDRHGALPTGWHAISTAAELAAWERAWAGEEPAVRTFPDALLAHPACTFLAWAEAGAVVAGVALHRSHGVVGISNVFARAGAEDRTWSAVVGVAQARARGLPLVGWESGQELEAARRAGFEPCGPLRVWVR